MEGSLIDNLTFAVAAMPFYESDRDAYFVRFQMTGGHETIYGPIASEEQANTLAEELVAAYRKTIQGITGDVLARLSEPSP